MPEISEVTRLAERLNTEFTDRTVEGSFGKYTIEQFTDFLPCRISFVKNKGKLMYFGFAKGKGQCMYATCGLRMNGRWTTTFDGDVAPKKPLMGLELDNGNTLYLSDRRGWATFNFHNTKRELQEELDKLGPSILSKGFSWDVFEAACQRYKRRNVTAFLMDQSVFSGCGNFIKAETLFHARISPLRKVGELDDEERQQLYDSLVFIAKKAYEHEDRKWVEVYNHEFATQTKTPDGRITHWDPTIQV